MKLTTMKHYSLLLFATTLSLTLSGPVCATTHTIVEVIDATRLVDSLFLTGQATPFELAAGDTLNLTFQFLPGQSLQVTNVVALTAFLSAATTTEHQVTTSNSMTFIGLSGSAHNPAPTVTTTTGRGLISAFYGNGILQTPPNGVISFSGVSFSIGIMSFSSGLASMLYATDAFAVNGSDFVVSSVPEVSSKLLLSLGITGIVLIMRRRLPN